MQCRSYPVAENSFALAILNDIAVNRRPSLCSNNAFLKSLSPFQSDATNKTGTHTLLSPAAQTKRARLERAAAAFDKFQKRINDENSPPPLPPPLPVFTSGPASSPQPRNHDIYQHPSFGRSAVGGSYLSGEEKQRRPSSSCAPSAAWPQPAKTPEL